MRPSRTWRRRRRIIRTSLMRSTRALRLPEDSMDKAIDRVESELRRAVAARRYGEAQRLLCLFCEAAAGEWASQDAARARQVFERLESVLDWTRTMLCITQAS